MGLSDFEVFTEFTYTAATEVLRQQIDLFNAATAGAIVLRAAANVGDYTDSAFYAKVADLVRRRNVYGSGAVTEKELAMLTETSVKVAAGTPPVRVDPAWWTWIQRNPEEGGVIYGKQLAIDMMADMLNTAIMAGVAALSGQATNIHDGSAATADFGDLLTGASKMGDASQAIRVWITHSKVMFDIWGVALANGASLFTFGTINVRQDGFGRPIVITDSPSLVNLTPTPDVYRSIGLVSGGIMVEQNNDFDQNVETSNGSENIKRTIQSEWTYNLSVKGFAWDKGSGGHSPNDAAIASTANWDKVVTSHKDLAGVLVLTQ